MLDLFGIKTLLSLLKVLRLRKPGVVFLVIRKEVDNMLKFVLVVPPPAVSDVVSRRIFLQVGSGEPVQLTLTSTDTETPLLSGEEDDTVTGSLVDVDNAGNSSDPRDFSFVLVDTIAPPQPGELGLRVDSEE